MDKIPRSASNHQPYFLQYGRHSKFGSTFGINPSYLSTNFSNYYYLVYNYIHAKLIKLGPEDLSYLVFTSDAISEVSQHEFNMEELTVSPKHVKLPRNEYNCIGITGLKITYNPIKVVDIAEDKTSEKPDTWPLSKQRRRERNYI